MNDKTCVSLLQTPQAKLFGVPNFVLGILYYLILMLAGMVLPLENLDAVYWGLVGATFITVIAGAYLIYSLMFVLRTNCPLCYASHAINFVLLVLFIIHAL